MDTENKRPLKKLPTGTVVLMGDSVYVIPETNLTDGGKQVVLVDPRDCFTFTTSNIGGRTDYTIVPKEKLAKCIQDLATELKESRSTKLYNQIQETKEHLKALEEQYNNLG